MCSAESLHDGTFDIADVALFNDLLALKVENEWRIQDANAKAQERKR